MSTISTEKKTKISEHILSYLFSIFPRQIFTSDIAKELARDEEFIKKLLMEMEQKGFVTLIKKNSKGVDYSKRMRWRISGKTYEIYKQHQ